MRKKRKLTPLQQEAKRQITRIRRAEKRLEKRGFLIDESFLPKVPNRITSKFVKRLQQITPKKMYESVQYVDQMTGEIISGVEGRKLERKRAALKGELKKKGKIGVSTTDSTFFDRVIIHNWLSIVNEWNEKARRHMVNFLNQVIARTSEHDAAVMLQNAAEAGYELDYKMAYDNERRVNYLNALRQYLPDQGNLFWDELFEALEEDEQWEEPD